MSRSLVPLGLLAVALIVSTVHADAQQQSGEMTIGPPRSTTSIAPSDDGPLSPDEQAAYEQTRQLIADGETLGDKINTVASNSGLSAAADQYEAARRGLDLLKQGKAPNGAPLSIRVLKRLMGTKGADRMGQVRALQERAGKLAARLEKYAAYTRRLGTVMTAIDPLSKVAGSAAEGDVEGALVKFASGACKIVVTGGAAMLGTTALGPAGGIVAAGAADAGYEAYIAPLWGKMEVDLANLKARHGLQFDRLKKAYGDAAVVQGVSLEQGMELYMRGASEAWFRDFTARMREQIQERRAQIAAQREKERAATVAALRKMESAHPELKSSIDRFAEGKLDMVGQARLLRDLQRIVAPQCRDQLAREVMGDWLAGLTHDKVQKVLASARIAPARDFYQCLCRNYSITGTGVGYHPEKTRDCNNTLPCKGGNWGCVSHDFPRWREAWEKCLARSPLFVEKDAAGKVIDPGIRIDEYLAGIKVLRDLKRNRSSASAPR